MNPPGGTPPTGGPLPPLALYLHFPWCIRKCPYCDFNSHAVRDGLPEQAYIDALTADLRVEAAGVRDRTISSIFMGGGTPSLFSPAAMSTVLQTVRAELDLTADAEITLEANPGASDQARFAGYRDAGVNRLSIGIQSFDDSRLQAIGRVHDSHSAHAAAQAARSAGFDNFNLDLMYGLPGQSADEAGADLLRAIAHAPEHLSWYQLTLEPNTEFHVRPPVLPDEEAVEDIEQRGHGILADAGYTRYEVSAYARNGRRCRHNLNYWMFGDYLGVGAGAHGKLTLAAGVVQRYSKERHPARYMERCLQGDARQEQRLLEADDLRFEFMLNALRLSDGFQISVYAQRTGLAPETITAALQAAEQGGLLIRRDDHYQTTDLGKRYLNDLIGRFLPA